MRKRVREQDAVHWASKFLETLSRPIHCRTENHCFQCVISKEISTQQAEIGIQFSEQVEGRKVLFLDFDCTLAPPCTSSSSPRISSPPTTIFRDMVSRALTPLLQRRSLALLPNFLKQHLVFSNKQFLSLLQKLGGRKDLDIVLISDRSCDVLDQEFEILSHLPITLVSEHSYNIRKPGEQWRELTLGNFAWKAQIRPYLEMYMRDTPGSVIAEKKMGLIWDYAQSEPDLGQVRAADLVGQLSEFIHNLPIEIHHSKKKL